MEETKRRKMIQIKVLWLQYKAYFIICLALALFGSGVFTGCKLDEPDCSTCEQLKNELVIENATLRKANSDYADYFNKKNEEAKKATEHEEAMKNELAKGNREAKASLALRDARIKALEKRLKKAEADPRCAELLELEVCGALPMPLSLYSR